MIDDPPLKHHRAIIELLGAEPALSAEAINRVAEREIACGAGFPASVKEWFTPAMYAWKKQK